SRDFVLRAVESQNHEYEYRRLEVMGNVVGGRTAVVCAGVEAVLQLTMPKKEFCDNTLTIKPAMAISITQLTTRLYGAGYQRRFQVEGPGQFSVRGGIVDIYAPDMRLPARVEFWGDEIDTIHSFDIVSQRREAQLKKIYLSPAREVLFGSTADAAQLLRNAIGKISEPRRTKLQGAAQADLQALDNGVMPSAMDKYLPLRYKKAETILGYFEDEIIFLNEPSAVREAAKAAEFRFNSEIEHLLEDGVLAPPLDKFYEDIPFLMAKVSEGRSIACENFARTISDLKLKDIVNAAAHSLPPWSGEVSALIDDVRPLIEQKYAVAVFAGTQRAGAALARDFELAKIPCAAYHKEPVLASGSVCIVEGHLSAGTDYPFAKLAIFTSRRHGQGDKAKVKAKKKGKGLASLTDIAPGDYVVHQNHGIGIYVGIQRLDLQGVVKDYIKISYDKGDTLYVPVTQLDIISRYTAPGDSEHIKLAKLGGTEWTKTKSRVRAAFKCIMGSRQCAILVPTTILAWQHYNTILSRMEAFPVKVGLLSRFRTAKQQKETIKGLNDGTVDIVVGTHRMLQKDIKFNSLGLVIIDEEQRFGVKDKEKLKENFIGVDMLTLSATPIPRTLNMAMSGIRDMSTIGEPPFERRPIETYVMEYDDNVITDAIRKELARGGQVYYLHNRVETIDSCAARIAEKVENARVATAHGRMTEEQLSRVWQQLLDGEIDVLVCTTIIETGVDVRNCNTLIIEDSDRMGLAQLYQIRGRVGRSGRKAYAYFTFRRDKVLTDIAAKRLSAIREFTSFGSGFRIAMRDLQIRGAGNLLGQSQHGHMEAVGYEMYVKLLNNAIAEEKGEVVSADKSDCLIDVTLDAYIPEGYIDDAAGRIEAYKRIAAIAGKEDASDVLDELIDRYGDIPKSVEGLVDISLIRVLAANLGIYEITQNKDSLIFYSDKLDLQSIRPLMLEMGKRVLVNASGKPYLSVKLMQNETPIELMNAVFAKMGKLAT
ncbi:MAG: TRCF domain-containing protein, partial [Oscillospiraceae bacterium]